MKDYSRVIDKFLSKRKETISLISQQLAPYLNTSDSLNFQALELIKLRPTLTEISRMLRNKQLTSKQLVAYYMNECITKGIDLNAATQFNRNALKEADEADLILNSEDKVNLPLLGIPFTVKDHIAVKDFYITVGCAKNLDGDRFIAKKDADIVKVLKDLGGIVIAISNPPMSLMGLEAVNNIFGSTKNPWRHEFSTGGSSGGEAALIASGCSIFGLGSDQKGSVRNPAGLSGIYGFIPTQYRISNFGILSPIHKEFFPTYPSIGPMTRSVEDLIFLMKNLYGKFSDLNPFTFGMKFNEDKQEVFKTMIEKNRSLRIGYMLDSPFFELSSSVRTSMEKVIRLASSLEIDIKGKSIKCNTFEIPSEIQYMIYETVCEYFKFVANGTPRSGKISELEGESPIQCLAVPAFDPKSNEERVRWYFDCRQPLDSERLLRTLTRLEELKHKFFEWMLENNVDSILMPNFPIPGFLRGDIRFNHFGDNIMLCNAFGMPCGTLPIGIVSEEKDTIQPSKKYGKDSVFLVLKDHCDKVSFKGLPIGMHVMALPNRDEMCLYLMESIDKKLKF